MIRTVSLNEVPISDKPTHIVIYHESTAPTSENSQNELLTKIHDLSNRLETLYLRVASLEKSADTTKVCHINPSPFFSSAISPSLNGMDVMRLVESTGSMDAPIPTNPTTTLFNTLVANASASAAVNVTNANAKAEEEAEDADDEGEAEDEAEAEDAEGENEEAEAEAEAMELEEFEYKGATYYRDSDNQVYQKDTDGDLDDTPIGVWNETKQKLLKYPSQS